MCRTSGATMTSRTLRNPTDGALRTALESEGVVARGVPYKTNDMIRLLKKLGWEILPARVVNEDGGDR